MQHTRLSPSFDDRFIRSANLVFEGLLHNSTQQNTKYPLEFCYANLRLPRQCGKTLYLCNLANLLAAPDPHCKRNVWFFSGLDTRPKDFQIPLQERVNFVSFRNRKSLADINMMFFMGLPMDILLFDEVHPALTTEFLVSDQIKLAAASSDQFVAFSLHTMDTVGLQT